MRRARATAQLLHPARRDARAVVGHLVGVQAQDARSARLALRARGVTEPGEDGLCVSWLMRGTLHLVREEDLPWLHAACAPAALPRARRRLAQLGVDAPEVPLARIDLPCDRAAVAAATGLSGQAVPNLLMYGALTGRLVRSLDGVFRTASLRLPDREAALRELGRRYGAAHAHATPRDLARWAGIPLRDVRGPAPARPHPDAGPVGPRLLPPFDPYLLGWADRGFAVPDALARRVFPGGGTLRATATVDGEVIGTWGASAGRVTLDVPDPALFAAEIDEVQSLLGRPGDRSPTGPGSG